MRDEKKLIDLKTRTKQFALKVIQLYSSLPQKTEAQIIGKQMLRSGTSVEHITVRELEVDQMRNL